MLGGKIYKIKKRGNRTKDIYEVRFGGRYAYNLAHKLWDKATIYIQRKYLKFLKIKDNKYPKSLKCGISHRPTKLNPNRYRVYVNNKDNKVDSYADSYEEALRILESMKPR